MTFNRLHSSVLRSTCCVRRSEKGEKEREKESECEREREEEREKEEG